MAPARARLLLALLALVALAGIVVAGQFGSYDTAVDTIVDPGSTVFRHEVGFESTFGADPLVLLVEGDVKTILGGAPLTNLANDEGVLYSPANLARGVASVNGPTSLAGEAGIAAATLFAGQVQRAQDAAKLKATADAKAAGKSDAEAQQAATAAGQAAATQALQDAARQFPDLAADIPLSPTNPKWVTAILLDKDGKPKVLFAAVVPDSSHLLVTARLRPGVGESGIRAILASERTALQQHPIAGASTVLTGLPVLQLSVARALGLALVAGMAVGAAAILVLLLAALRGVAPGLRLLPLAGGILTVAVLGGAVTLVGLLSGALKGLVPLEQGFLQSLLATFNLGLNPATMAAFPIALGLGVDYAVQFVVRLRQEMPSGRAVAIATARRAAGRATGRAALCTVAGLAALLTSSIPMVRQFGIVMAMGTALGWVFARSLTSIALRAVPGLGAAGITAAPVDPGEEVALFGLSQQPALPGGHGQAAGASGAAARVVEFGRRRGRLILGAALALAIVGWVALPFSSYETDPERLAGTGLPAFHDLNRVRQATGSSGELDFVLSGPDVTSPDALAFGKQLQEVALRDSDGRLRPAASLSDLLTTLSAGKELSADRVKAFLQLIPGQLTDSLVSRDHHLARFAFGINLSPVAQQAVEIQRVIDDMEAPLGYTFYPAGISYIGVNGLETLRAGQAWLNLGGAALVFLTLMLLYRRRRVALLAWVPTLLVAGWSTAILTLLKVPLTPMTAVLGALIVAFGTEFAVLWLERYRDVVYQGATPGIAAAEEATAGAGAGILVSGCALGLGFLALTVGGLPGLGELGFDLPMVREFGLVAAMDIGLAVLAALVVLPAMVVRFGLDYPPGPVAQAPR
ncbi:MAG: MMPL family transporter [Candidatus Dormibacteria bacterium]